MKKLLLFISLFYTVNVAFAQTADQVVLTNVGLDSLKKAVELYTKFKLFYIQTSVDEPLKLSLTLNREGFIDSLSNSLSRIGYSLSQDGYFLYILKGPGIVSQLPEYYFSTLESRIVDSINYFSMLSSTENREAGSASKVYVIGDPNIHFTGNRAVLSGSVRSLDSREPVAGIMVMAVSTGVNVSTDQYGYYKIAVPLGKTDLLLKGYGFEDTPLMLEVFADGVLDITIKERVYTLSSVVVSAESSQQRSNTYVGVERISINRIKHIPVVFGEADVMKVVLTLPGVKSVGESSGGFNVRGGATDQNLILFNEGTLYNPTHLFGLFSSFNPDVTSNIELYKSTIPAKYGGRISSVLEVNSRQGNNNKLTGSAGLGLLTGKFHLEGPIIKEKTTFIAGARTTYSNWILKALPQSSGYRDGSANFYDLTGGVSHRINQSNDLYLYAYYSSDQFSFSKDTTYAYSNANFAIKWRTIFSSKHSMTFSSGYDLYQHNLEEKANPETAYEMHFGIKQLFAKADFDLLIGENHTLSYGLNAVYFMISPGEMKPIGSSLVLQNILDQENGFESALFVNDKWNISNRFSIDMGIRYNMFVTPNNTNIYHGPEYRLSASYLLDNNFTIKAGFNTMRQNIHMISNTAAASPIDTWKLSDAHLVPQTGWQAAAGLYQNLFNHRWEVSLEGYYKAMDHYLDYKSGAVLNMNKHIDEDVIETEGKAYGVELMFKKPSGKLNGWLAYTYSKTMLREAGKKELYEINSGLWYPAAYDKPHDVKMVMNYKFTQRYSFSANFDYASGRPVTIPISMYYYGKGYRLEYSNRNQYRIPDYIRLDLAFNIEPSHNLKLRTHSIITFGVYNIAGRKNAFSVYYTTTEGEKIQGYKLSIFGAPIPYINYTIKF